MIPPISPVSALGRHRSSSPLPVRRAQPLLAISKGIDRDRAVDESVNHLGVLSRRGALPLIRAETQGLNLRTSQLYTVTDEPVERPYSAQGTPMPTSWLDRVRSSLGTSQ